MAAARLLATLALDVRLQARHALYPIGIVVALSIGLALRWLERATVAALLPGLWLGAIGSTTFMFVAGMILFEKSERTVDALVVTPLPIPTYLTSKVVTLSGFALIESFIVLLLSHGVGNVAPLPLLLGIVALGVMYTLVGIIQVVSHHSVTDFLVPGGIVCLTVLQVPALDAFGVWFHPLLYLFPTQAPVMLMKGAFGELSTGQWLYGVGYSLGAIVVFAGWAHRRFQRCMVERRHGRKTVGSKNSMVEKQPPRKLRGRA
ncbi:MAG: hypothetical protein AAF560_05240 [Acidobacteriota bacterium]